MSMNLCFKTKKGNYHIEFPYQTQTKLTYGVLNESNNEKRIEMIVDDIISFNGSNVLIQECIDMLNDDSLELRLI